MEASRSPKGPWVKRGGTVVHAFGRLSALRQHHRQPLVAVAFVGQTPASMLKAIVEVSAGGANRVLVPGQATGRPLLQDGRRQPHMWSSSKRSPRPDLGVSHEQSPDDWTAVEIPRVSGERSDGPRASHPKPGGRCPTFDQTSLRSALTGGTVDVRAERGPIGCPR